MKKIFQSLMLVLLLLAVASKAQEKKYDTYPAPVGGMQELLKDLVYPAEAKEKNIEGKVILKLKIDNKGNVVDVKVEKSLGYGCDEAAVYTMKKAKFSPAVLNGKNVESEVLLPVMFKLENEKK